MDKPRLLKADEIECRIQSLNKGKGANENKCFAVLILYKDARTDMHILDETYGAENWQKAYKSENENLFCGVAIWCEPKGWVWKWDAGAPSNQSAEKGHASDAFKRACVNWGIGRELYAARRLFLELNKNEYYIDNSGNPKVTKNANFSVKSISYSPTNEIESIEIIDKKGTVRLKK